MIRIRYAAAFLLASVLQPCHAQADAGTYKATTATTPVELRAGAGTGAVLSSWPTADACNTAAEEYAKKQAAKKDSVATCRPAGGNVSVKYTAPPPVTTWVRLGPEKNGYSIAAPTRVRFGVGSTWAVKSLPAGVFWCGTGTFGDPASGVAKVCEREEGGSTTPAPSEPAASEPSAPTNPTTPIGGVPKPSDFAGYPTSGPIVARSGQIIEKVRISNPAGNCVIVPAGVTGVTIRDAELGPCGSVPADQDANGVKVSPLAGDVTIQRTWSHHVSSCLYAEPGSLHPIVYDRNLCTDIRGPDSRSQAARGQMAQINGVRGPAKGTRITCNVSDQTGADHAVEDHINLFDSGGTADDPIEVAYNRLRGGHQKSNSGSGIMTGDGSLGGHLRVHDNTVVNVRNVGIGVAGGTDVQVKNNRIFMSGAATYTNVGIYVWSQGGGVCTGHAIDGNRVFVAASNGGQNPWWNGGNCGPVALTNNQFGDTTLTAAIFDEVPAPCR